LEDFFKKFFFNNVSQASLDGQAAYVAQLSVRARHPTAVAEEPDVSHSDDMVS